MAYFTRGVILTIALCLTCGAGNIYAEDGHWSLDPTLTVISCVSATVSLVTGVVGARYAKEATSCTEVYEAPMRLAIYGPIARTLLCCSVISGTIASIAGFKAVKN